jgi:hypothetical protein
MSLRPSLAVALAVALGGALSGPAVSMQPKAVQTPRVHPFFPGGLLGGFLPSKQRRPRYRSKPRTTVAAEKRKSRKRRNQLRHKAHR